MSKYEKLWQAIAEKFKVTQQKTLQLSFEELENMGETKIDHSFLSNKKELQNLGYRVVKISLKNKNIIFENIKDETR